MRMKRNQQRRKLLLKKEESDDDDSSSDDDDEEEASVKKPVKEEEPELKIKNNKNKSFNETPQKSHNQSFGNKSMSEEGRKIFIHNVSEEAQAAIAAMNGTHVCGRDIECNIAKPRGDRNGGRGGGGRGGGRGRGGRGGGRGGRGGMSISVGGGGANKKMTFD